MCLISTCFTDILPPVTSRWIGQYFPHYDCTVIVNSCWNLFTQNENGQKVLSLWNLSLLFITLRNTSSGTLKIDMYCLKFFSFSDVKGKLKIELLSQRKYLSVSQLRPLIIPSKQKWFSGYLFYKKGIPFFKILISFCIYIQIHLFACPNWIRRYLAIYDVSGTCLILGVKFCTGPRFLGRILSKIQILG